METQDYRPRIHLTQAGCNAYYTTKGDRTFFCIDDEKPILVHSTRPVDDHTVALSVLSGDGRLKEIFVPSHLSTIRIPGRN